jgi:hypothetical protein
MAYADTVPADGDGLKAGDQGVADLGSALPGAVIVRQVTISLVCAGTTHASPGSTISVAFSSATVPGDGDAEATDTTIGPVPANWAATGCTSPAQTLPANAPSTVTLTMPTTPGNDQEFTVMWSRSGSSGLTGMTTVTFIVDVLGNTPPTLHLPADQLVEATSAAGAVVTFSATATDAEDASPPSVTCSPASGSTFPLLTTTVTCSTTDSGGLTVTGSFLVTVEDTTAPSIGNVPDDISVATSDAGGVAVSWPALTAQDLVDPSPSIACDPPSGSTFAVGTTTTVTCTARDEAGNTSRASFRVSVALVSAVTWTAIWGEPVATDGSTFVANPGRTLPVKVRLFADGVEQTSGSATLTIATCAGAPAGSLPMTWGGGRWNGSLDTGSMGGAGCYVATASLDGNAAGSFRIELRGAEPLSGKALKARSKP